VVVVELANKPWISHMHDVYDSQEAILRAGLKETGMRWTMQRVYQNEWFGIRDLWVLCRVDRVERVKSVPDCLKLFPMQLTHRTRPMRDEAPVQEEAELEPGPDLGDIQGTPEELADTIKEATAVLLDSRAIKQQSIEFMKSLEIHRQEDGN